MNELIFILYTLLIGALTIAALRYSTAALVALISVEAVLMNLFVPKQIMLCGITATAADPLAIGASLGISLLQKTQSLSTARDAIVISFGCILFYTAVSLLHTIFVPAPTDTCHDAFLLILSITPRLLLASACSYAVAQYTNTALYTSLQTRWHVEQPVLLTGVSLALSQLLDTVLFTVLGMYRLVPGFEDPAVLLSLALVSYSLKLFSIVLAVPYVYLAQQVTAE